MEKFNHLFIEKVNFSDVNPDCYKARYKVYCEEKQWIDPNVFPNLEETDQYDKYSKHIIVYNENWEVKGYARFIVKSDGIKLPIEYHPGIISKKTISDKAGESSRFIVLDKNIRMAVTFILLRSLLQTAGNLKIRDSYIVVEQSFIRYLNRIGYICEPLSGPEKYFGDHTVPVKVDVNATENNLKIMNNQYGDWFFDESPFVSANDFIFQYLYTPATSK